MCGVRIKKLINLNSRAFSLVEIMVALIITSIISIAVVSLYSTGLRNFFQIKETSKQANESIVLFNLLEKDLSRGGFNHPFRGNPEAGICGVSAIYAVDALRIISSEEVSSCYDKIFFLNDGAYIIERFKITYKLGVDLDGDPSTPADTDTLYKKIERTDDCNTIITLPDDLSVNARAFIHGWQPVSSHIQSFEVTAVADADDKIDIEITFQSPQDASVSQNFKKRIFLKNKLLALNSRLCADYCPNSVKPFADYLITDDANIWDPEEQSISGARVFFESDTFDFGESGFERLFFPDDVVGVAGDFSVADGILTITGVGSPAAYQEFIRRIQYWVRDDEDPATEGPSPVDPAIKNISLVLGADACDNAFDLQIRLVNSVKHAYCYISGTLRWDEAKVAATEKDYFGLTGFLATIDDISFLSNILNDGEDGWIGGKKKMGTNEAGDAAEVWTWTEPGLQDQVCYENLLEEAFHCIDNGLIEILSHTANLSGLTCGNLAVVEEQLLCEAVSAITYIGQQYYLYSSFNSPTFKATYLNGDNGSEIGGYILEFNDNVYNCDPDTPLGCVNYYQTKQIVTNDPSYTNPNMVNLCYIPPD